MKNRLKYTKIKDLAQYNEYCDIHEQLMIDEDAAALDEIELLEVLIEDYDRRMSQGLQHQLNPVELLRSLLADAELSQSEFAREVEISRQLVSDILAYRRNISKELVIKFSKAFAMSQEAFSRPYDLEANRAKLEKIKVEKKTKLTPYQMTTPKISIAAEDEASLKKKPK